MADKQVKPAKAPAAKPEVKAVRMTLLKDTASINAAIKSIAGRAAKLDKDIHVAAVSVIRHTAQHNDPDFTTRLVDALGKSQRRQALIAWILNYGAMAQDETGKLVYNVKRREQVLSDENIAAAEAEPFWDFAPEPKYVQFDLAKAMQALLKKAEKALGNREQDTSLVQPDKLAALRAIAEPVPTVENGAGPAA